MKMRAVGAMLEVIVKLSLRAIGVAWRNAFVLVATKLNVRAGIVQ